MIFGSLALPVLADGALPHPYDPPWLIGAFTLLPWLVLLSGVGARLLRDPASDRGWALPSSRVGGVRR